MSYFKNYVVGCKFRFESTNHTLLDGLRVDKRPMTLKNTFDGFPKFSNRVRTKLIDN